jgi:predicted nucleic acid-binding Zn finger protein
VSDRVEGALASGSVKLALFVPSGRKIWTVVGREGEYWTDPELGFCTCKDFYFTTLSGGEECYHLKSVRKAMKEGRFSQLEFSDGDYGRFLQALADDAESSILR